MVVAGGELMSDIEITSNLVVSSRGHGPLTGAILGSVSRISGGIGRPSVPRHATKTLIGHHGSSPLEGVRPQRKS